jgi:polysaccharide chain length determinant protein (PEP-CTERM system associated)
LILIERQQVPDTYVKPVITEDLNARVADLQQQVLSRTRLLPIIDRFGLFKVRTPHASTEELMELMLKAVSLTAVKTIITSGNEVLPGFRVEVTLDDPQKAQQVCHEIVSMFVSENIRQRENSAQGTVNFLQSQLDEAKRKLDEQDARLAAFKRQRMGTLPDEVQTNINLLTTLNTQLESVNQGLNRAQQDKVYSESVLAQQLQAWQATQRAASGDVTNPTPDDLEKHLADLKKQLVSLRAKYTNAHPDVVALQTEIEEITKRINNESETSGQKPPQGSGDSKPVTTPEPPQIQQLRAQVHAATESVATFTHDQERLQEQIKQYQSRLQLSPAVEQEYKEITRDHQTALLFYNELLGKRDQSTMATDMERQAAGERFRVLDPANLPEKPSFPNRPLFAAIGLAAGLALGYGLAYVGETNSKCLRTKKDVEFYLGTTTLVVIPIMGDGVNRKVRRGTGRKAQVLGIASE